MSHSFKVAELGLITQRSSSQASGELTKLQIPRPHPQRSGNLLFTDATGDSHATAPGTSSFIIRTLT